MTEQQRNLLRFLERYQAEHDGVSPTLAEMADALGLSAKSGAHRLVEHLIDQGRLRRNGRCRGYEVTGPTIGPAAITDADLLAEVARRGLLGGTAC